MSTNYPSGLDSFTTHHDNVSEPILAADINKIQDGLAAVETELGLTPKGSSSDVATRLGTLAQETIRTSVKTTNFTASAGQLVPVDTTSGNVTITLPTAPSDKSRVAVKHVVRGGTNTVTIARGGSDVFNVTSGSTTLTLTLANQAVTLVYQAAGAIWTVVSDDLSLSQLDTRFSGLVVIDGGTATASFAAVPVGASYLTTTQIASDAAFTGTYAQIEAKVINFGQRSGVDRTGTTASDTALAAVLAGASTSSPVIIDFPPGVYRLDNAYTIDPRAVSVRGIPGKSVLDFSHRSAAGPVLSIYGSAIYFDQHRTLEGVKLVGSATSDGLSFGGGAAGGSGSGQWAPFITMLDVTITGFATQISWGENTWNHVYVGLNCGSWTTRWGYFPSTSNAGEQMQFIGCDVHGPNETLVSNQSDAGFRFIGGSLDGTGRQVYLTAGSATLTGVWIEGTGAALPAGAAEIFKIDHSGSQPPTLVLQACTIVPKTYTAVTAIFTVAGSGLGKLHIEDPLTYTSSDTTYGPPGAVFIQDTSSAGNGSDITVVRPMWLGPKSLTVPDTARIDYLVKPTTHPGISNLYGSTGGRWLGTTTSGTPTGTGPFYPGDWVTSTAGPIYVNVGTKASPQWATISFLSGTTPGSVGTATAGASGQAAGAGHRHALASLAGAKTAPYTAAAGEYVPVNAAGGAITVTSPAPATALTFFVSKVDSSGNAVTVSFASGTYKGASTVNLSAQWQTLGFISDGTNWLPVASGGLGALAFTDTITASQITDGASTYAPLLGSTCPLESALYYCPTPGGSPTTATPPEATERGFPFVAGRTCTLDRIGLEVTSAGTSGALVRLGIRTNNAGRPGNVLLDAGTIDGTSNTVQTITISQNVTAGSVYWLTATVQGGAGTRPTIRTCSGSSAMIGDATAATVSANSLAAYSAAGVSGALANGGSWASTTAIPRIFIRAA